MANITYAVYHNCVAEEEMNFKKNWKLFYELLSESDVRCIASWDNIKPDRIEKLITHNSKKFNRMKNSRCGIIKVFHKQPVETIPMFTQLQNRIDELLNY